MCKYWSCVLLRPGMERDGKRVLWLKDTNSHGEIMEHYELSDGKLVDRDHVKYEIAPTDIFSAERDDWSLRLDEARTLPEWYAEDTLAADAAVWAEWSNMVKELHAALGTLDLGRRDAMVERVKALRPGDRTISRSTVRAAVNEHVKRLTARDDRHRAIAISDVRFYTPAEWASVWDSVVSDDEDNHGVPLIEILEHGCVLYGVDMDGVAHVVMLGQDGDL